MRIKDMNWMQVEDYLKKDDRALLPMGSTEQHAQLSLMVDCILSERVVDMLPVDVPSFEYRHTPDPREIDQILLPMLEDIRGTLATETLAKPSAPLRRSHEN